MHEALAARLDAKEAALAPRRKRITDSNRERREAACAAARAGDGAPMSAGWVSHCLDQVKGEARCSELGADPSVLTFERPATYFSHSLAGGLGWVYPRRSAPSSPCRSGW